MGPFRLTYLLAINFFAVGVSSDGRFILPNLERDIAKPVVPADLAHYFQLSDSKARRIVDAYLPGVIPPATFEVLDNAGTPQSAVTVKVPTAIVRGVELAERIADGKLKNPLNEFLQQSAQTMATSGGGSALMQVPKATGTGGSSIAGIPNVFPSLPKAPVAQNAPVGMPNYMAPYRPEVPEAGLGPLAASQEPKIPEASTGGFTEIFQPLLKEAREQLQLSNIQQSVPGLRTSNEAEKRTEQSSYVDMPFPVPEPPQKRGGLVTQILHSVGLNRLAEQISLDEVKAVSGLKPPGSGDTGILAGALYNILSNSDPKERGRQLSKDMENAVANPNLAIIENLLLQPNSPLCLPKPKTVDNFNIDSFLGRWYQVVYSPPLSSGPCSMLTYKKVSKVGKGNVGTIFDTFEYTTGTAPYSKPKIASGYGVVKNAGQLVFRTSNSPNDIRVNVIKTGPVNADGLYEYVVMTVTCNYPLHVLARDPVQYKIRYEAEVNEFLEEKKLIAPWSKALNLVAPVDFNFCTYPPTLFSVN